MGQKLRPWKTVIALDLNAGPPIYQQVADALIDEIKKGRLGPGTPLPGTRQLAEDLGVNRKTIVNAFDDLVAEGWLTTNYKRGTFVSDKLPVQPVLFRQKKADTISINFSFNAVVEKGDPFIQRNKNVIVFDDGLPDVRLTPTNELVRVYKRIFQQNTRWRMMGYGNPKGTEKIRAALSDMLRHDRGLDADPENICVTRGSQMALYLAAMTLITKGDVIGIEEPGYAPAWKTFTQCGAKLLPLKVDEGGVCIGNLEKICNRRKLKAIYVTPHHQFPTTVSMKIDRRLKLLELSNRFGFAIIEDDYDHEFHFNSKSLLPLASHAGAGNVIYISSLSKIVAPAVRIGYILGPTDFISSVAGLRKYIDIQGDSVMEYAIAELMQDGTLRKHVRKAHNIYGERREIMERLIVKHLGERVTFTKPEGGLAYWVKMNKKTDTRQLAQLLAQKSVSVIPTEPFSFGETPLNALRLGYASLTEDELETGLRILNKVLTR